MTRASRACSPLLVPRHDWAAKSAASRYSTGGLIDIEEKAVAETDEAWVVTGYASIFNNRDLGDDIVLPGTWTKSIESMRETGRMPLFLFNHKMHYDAPIGAVVDLREDKRGLWFKSELPKDDSFVAGRIVPQLKRRGLKGVSVGYRCRDFDRKDGARLIKRADLIEISIVNLPMNPLASVETVKSERLGEDDWTDMTVREREAHLVKACGLSEELAKRFIRLDREDLARKGQREAAVTAGDVSGLDLGLDDLSRHLRDTLNRF